MFDSSRNCQHDCMFFTFPPAIYESQLFSPTKVFSFVLIPAFLELCTDIPW